jgi:hypothetical protein
MTERGSTEPISPSKGEVGWPEAHFPPPALRRRALAVILLLPLLLAADLAFAVFTLVNTLALIATPDPISRLELLIIEGALFAVDLLLIIAHLQLAPWLVTGKWIRRWEDVKGWALRP